MGAILSIILILISGYVFGQEIPRDTSYTVSSTYKKLIKYHPDIKKVSFPKPASIKADEELVYTSVDGHGLTINVFYPAKKGTYPGVVMVHGGGWRSGDKSLQVPMAQKIADEGYVTATVEYRMSLEAPYPAALIDIKTAIRWLRANSEKYNLNKEQVAIYGASAGGQLAALVGTTNSYEKFEGHKYNRESSKVQAIIDVDGVLAFKHPRSKESTMAAEWLGGFYEEASDNWEEASALNHTDEDTPPVLFIASAYPRFHAGKEDMIEILKEHSIFYESHHMPGAPHAFWLFEPWFEPTFKYTLQFLNKVFKRQKPN